MFSIVKELLGNTNFISVVKFYNFTMILVAIIIFSYKNNLYSYFYFIIEHNIVDDFENHQNQTDNHETLMQSVGLVPG
jgi:hypothetical protein